ncbi:MAG: alpha/beta fold hydrolase, partial [Anaerolineae bacterium]
GIWAAVQTPPIVGVTATLTRLVAGSSPSGILMLLAAGGALLLVVMAMALVVWYGVDGITRRPTPDPPTTPADFDLPFEDATFTSRDRVTLRGYWMPPRDPACAAAVVICPGRAGSLDSDLPYAVPLCAAGYGVLIFDWRAHGRSDGRTVTLGYRERDDLRAALDWLSSRGVERIGLLGLSMGAATAIGVAADDSRIAAVVADSAFAQVETVIVGGLRERYVRNRLARPLAWLVLLGIGWQAGGAVSGADPLRIVGRVAPRPLLLIHGARDPYVPMDSMFQLYRAASAPKELWVVPEAGHREAAALRPKEYWARTLAFFAAWLPLQSENVAQESV